MKKNIFFVLILLCTNVALSKSRIFVFYINGVNTTQSEARINLTALENTAQISSNMLSNNYHFDMLYNKSDESAFCNLCNQLTDVFKQKAQEHLPITIDDFVVAYMKTYGLDYPKDSVDYQILEQGIKDDYLKDTSFVGNNLEDIYNQFRNKLQEESSFLYLKEFLDKSTTTDNDKPYVLLLPHSQGNLYANQLYDYTIRTMFLPAEHLAIYGIASPTSSVNGIVNPAPSLFGTSNPDDFVHYTTADNDFIINGLRVFSNISPLSNSPLTGNVHLNVCNDSNLCHSLMNAYLTDQTVAKQIAKQINLFFITLKSALIRNGLQERNIRFLYNPLIYNNNDILSVDILDPSKTYLCIDGTCDFNIMKFAKTGYLEYDYFDNYFILFSDDSSSGEYWLMANNKPVISTTGLFIGNMSNFVCNMVYKDGSGDNAMTYPLDPYTIDGLNMISVVCPAIMEDFSGTLPELYYNGRFIVAKFNI